MHELSICQSLIKQVKNVAVEHNAQSVTSITIAIGELSGVESRLLENAYPIASAGSIAENARLIIKHQAIRIKCRLCGSESEARPNKLVCKQCGDWQTTLLSGDELMLISVELEKSNDLESAY